jgi:hypothetical protein
VLANEGLGEPAYSGYLPLRVEAVTSYGGAERLVEMADHVVLRAQHDRRLDGLQHGQSDSPENEIRRLLNIKGRGIRWREARFSCGGLPSVRPPFSRRSVAGAQDRAR